MTDKWVHRTQGIRKVLRHVPLLYSRLLRIGMHLWRWSLRREGRKEKSLRGPGEVIWVDPGCIKEMIRLPLDRPYEPRAGAVQGGDWDRAALPIHDRGLLGSIGEPYEAEYAGTEVSQVDVVADGLRDGFFVAIDRRGQFLLVDGTERLRISKVRFSRVPVMPLLIHRRWRDFAAEVRGYAARHGGKTYQPTGHPDLQDIPSAHAEERLAILLDHMPIQRGRVLDIGANWGYFSRELARRGFECVAVESSMREAYFLRRLREAHDLDFEVVERSFLDLANFGSFDLTLALNIFHHFLKTEEKYEALRRFLRDLDTKFLIVETHRLGEGQMRRAFMNLAPEDFVQMVADWAGMAEVDFLGSAADARPIYMLSR